MKTIQSSELIGHIVKSGRHHRSRSLVAIVMPTVGAAGGGRIAFVAPKRLGGAVLRNRCKRVLRAGLQMALIEMDGLEREALLHNDIILMANNRTIDVGSGDISRELRELFPKIVQAKIQLV